jgi:PAS domain-containing protein
MRQIITTREQMAIAVDSTACRLFAKESGIDLRKYIVEFPDRYVEIRPRKKKTAIVDAAQLFNLRGKRIARKCWEWAREKAVIWSTLPKPLVFLASESGEIIRHSRNFTMNSNVNAPDKIWMGGRVEMTRSLYNALGEMIDSDQPQGLVTTDNIQVWLNPAAVRLFKLTSMEEAVPRDTSRDWLPVDLERKRQKVRDAGESAFEIDYATCVGDGSWKKLVNRYRLVDNKYLVGMNVSSEIIERPQITA